MQVGRRKGFKGVGDLLPRENFENWGPQTAGNALKLLILPAPRHFVSF